MSDRQDTGINEKLEYNLDVNSYTVGELYALYNLNNDDTIEIITEKFRKIVNDSEIAGHPDVFLLFVKRCQATIIESVIKIKYVDINDMNKEENREYMSKREYNAELVEYKNQQQQEENVTIKPKSLASFVWKNSVLEGGDKDVIVHPEAPTMNVSTNNYPQGAFNPVERKTIRRVLCMDSLFRQNPDVTSPNDIMFKLPQAIDKVVQMSLVSLDVPNIWYTFSDKYNNNVFTVYTYNAFGAEDTKHIVTIPAGNYMSDTLATLLNNYFSNSGNGLQYLFVEINQTTGKTIIRAKTDPDPGEPTYPFDPESDFYSPEFYYSIDFNNRDEDVGNFDCSAVNIDYNTAGWLLGYRRIFYLIENKEENTYTDYYTYQNKVVTYGCYLESESIYGDSVHDYIFVELDDYNNNFVSNTITSATREAYLGNNILARIPITSSHFHSEHSNKSDLIYKSREYFGPVTVEKMRIRLIDKYGHLINLHNNNFSFALEFTILYG
tara:strand:- start:678 stop:2159 length:1482 start_codon:yes stop_codon:yes gene_type:complete